MPTLQVSATFDSMPIDTIAHACEIAPQTETSNQDLQQNDTLAQATDTT